MPPCAALKRPSRRLVAPVNAPRSCPNSSASISVSGNAAQLTATNGPSARAAFVQRARHQLLARSALARDDHRRVAVRDRLHALDQREHAGRVSDQLIAARRRALQLPADRDDVAVQRPEGGQPLQLNAQLLEVDRLGQVVEGPLLQDGDRVGDGGVPGHHDHVGRRGLPCAASETASGRRPSEAGCRQEPGRTSPRTPPSSRRRRPSRRPRHGRRRPACRRSASRDPARLRQPRPSACARKDGVPLGDV